MHADDVNYGPDYAQLYKGAGTTTIYGNANISPHFPYAAQTWTSMWQRRSGQKVDGVIAVDPSGLSYLLAGTGPATMPDGSQVTAANVVALTQSAAYAKFPAPSQNAARREYLLDVARAVSSRLAGQHGNTVALVKAVQRAVSERRLLFYSSDAKVQADLVRASAAGAVPQTSAPYVGLSIVNDGGNKTRLLPRPVSHVAAQRLRIHPRGDRDHQADQQRTEQWAVLLRHPPQRRARVSGEAW